jgi:uncharacterized protein YyaL (SSP411 family)
MPNRLQNSASAYLQQHANNPVAWWPWSNEAWETAAAEGKWVVVSIGYSTCHWCHAMERDVFEKEEAALAMADFVCIKVDREERPDIDHTYMQAALAMNGQGGWPLNAIALPDGRPLWAGTYLPLDQWLALLDRIKTIQKEQPADAEHFAHQVETVLRSSSLPTPAPIESLPSPEELWDRVAKGWDGERFGHRRPQPFPLPDEWLQTAQTALHLEWPAALHHAGETLLAWHRSGTYDCLDGGLMRYATEPSKRIPHFEKMLYDNAQFATACLGTSALARHPLAYYPEWGRQTSEVLKQAAEQTLVFMETYLLQPNGLYGAGWDADSEGHEGHYYTWPEDELRAVLGPERAEVLLQKLRAAGGSAWEGRWILHEVALSAEDRGALQSARSQRIPPFQDTKALLGWNALAVVAWAHAARWGQNPDAAKQRALELGNRLAFAFFPAEGPAYPLEKIKATPPNRICYSPPAPSPLAQLEDLVLAGHAFLHLAALGDSDAWLALAEAWLSRALNDFPHLPNGQASTSRLSADRPFVEAIEMEDSVLPSANALLTELLLHVGLCTGDFEKIQAAQTRLATAKGLTAEHPGSHTHWLGLWTALEPLSEKTQRSAWTFGGSQAHAWRKRADDLGLLRPEDPVVLVESEQAPWATQCTANRCSAPYTDWEAFLAAASLR